MSLALTDAKKYVLRVLGGRDNTGMQTEAGEAIAAAMEWFCHRHNWSFLLRDTSQSFTVICATTDTDATVTVGTGAAADALKDVLAGMTVTGTGIPASTTVASVTSSGSIELSAAATATTNPVTLTFGGTIPIVAGTDTYSLPDRVFKPSTCRLVSTIHKPLKYVTQREIDYLTADQTVPGSVFAYTFYDGRDFDASGTQQHKIKFFRVPQQADVALLRYYRTMSATADPLDCKDEYQYALLAQARAELLRSRSATDRRIPIWEQTAERRLIQAIDTDFNEGGEDQLPRLMAPDEFSRGDLLSGEFWPSSDGVWPY